MEPMRVATMKMPPMVTKRVTMRSIQPASSAILPASRVRMRLFHNPSQKPQDVGSSGAAGMSNTWMRVAASRMMSSERTASQAMTAPVPVASVFSKR